MTPRTDDYVKNMIRRMLVDEGWVRREDVQPPVSSAPAVPSCDPHFGVPCPDWRSDALRNWKYRA